MENKDIVLIINSKFPIVRDYFDLVNGYKISCDDKDMSYCLNKCPFSGALCKDFDSVSKEEIEKILNLKD